MSHTNAANQAEAVELPQRPDKKTNAFLLLSSVLMASLSALHQTAGRLASFLLVRAEASSSQPRTRRCYSPLMSDSFILSDGSFVRPLPRVPRFDLCWSITPERRQRISLRCLVFVAVLKPDVHQRWLEAAGPEEVLLLMLGHRGLPAAVRLSDAPRVIMQVRVSGGVRH